MCLVLWKAARGGMKCDLDIKWAMIRWYLVCCMWMAVAVMNFIEQHMNIKFCLKFHNNPAETYVTLPTVYGVKALSHAETWWFKLFLRALRGCGRSLLQWTTEIYLQWKFGGHNVQFAHSRLPGDTQNDGNWSECGWGVDNIHIWNMGGSWMKCFCSHISKLECDCSAQSLPILTWLDHMKLLFPWVQMTIWRMWFDTDIDIEMNMTAEFSTVTYTSLQCVECIWIL